MPRSKRSSLPPIKNVIVDLNDFCQILCPYGKYINMMIVGCPLRHVQLRESVEHLPCGKLHFFPQHLVLGSVGVPIAPEAEMANPVVLLLHDLTNGVGIPSVNHSVQHHLGYGKLPNTRLSTSLMIQN